MNIYQILTTIGFVTICSTDRISACQEAAACGYSVLAIHQK
ncbi:hypothetical protein [Moraxella sp. ZY200743]